jgi:hypothetical protein
MALKLAKINIKKRKEAEKIVYEIFDILDPSGANTKKYKALFAGMSDNEFIKTMNNMWEDDTYNFILDIVDFERDIDLATVEKAAKKLGVPLEEDVVTPFLNMDVNNPVVTRTKVLVMYIIFKRMQQMTQKKNSTSIHISDRSATTGQVVGDDKNGRNSDVENVGLIAIGAVNVAKEFNGFRADGMQRKNIAYSSISTNGYVSLDEVESQAGISDRTVLNTIDTFYLGMGIKTDLVDDSLLLNSTAKNINKKE